jgi:asparagine synthase (glutamine-hydrolysing)
VGTLFAQVQRLPAAHYLRISLDDPESIRLERYWDIESSKPVDVSFQEATGRVRDLFTENVRLHLRSDVPVGAALSGGIDSSAIVSTMRQLEPSLHIHAFSYVAADPSLSEEKWIDLLSGKMGLHVHKIHISADDLLNDVYRVIARQGEPFATTSMYAQWRVFESARQAGIKVMLDGQGADELLAGYPNYRMGRISSLIKAGWIRDALRLSRSIDPNRWGKLFARAAVHASPSRLQATLRYAFRRNAVPPWLNDSWFLKSGVAVVDVGTSSRLSTMRDQLAESLTVTSLPQLLRYEDRNSMAFSVESRVPFLTPALAQYLRGLPEDYLISRDGTSKVVFRQAMRGIVPDPILDRRDKVGFPTPEKMWLASQGNMIHRILGGEVARNIAAFNVKRVLADWGRMMQGKMEFDSRVWRWANFILWTEKFSVVFH